jgi:hypothetical protein
MGDEVVELQIDVRTRSPTGVLMLMRLSLSAVLFSTNIDSQRTVGQSNSDMNALENIRT